MRPTSVFLGLLLVLPPVFCGDSNNATTITTPRANTTNIPESASPTITPSTSVSFTTTASHKRTAHTTFSSTHKPLPTTVQSGGSTTITPSTRSHSQTSNTVCLILFFCFLIVLLAFAYKWYTDHGRPSFPETRRLLAESLRNTWAVAVALLRPSPKKDENGEDMEAGIAEAGEEKKQGDDNEDDDSSDDYSSLGGGGMMEKPIKDEEEDRKSNQQEDSMSSVELKEETTEPEKDDLTLL
ncbi:uncharacterized protein LOC124381643 [Silurus meridionalis]|nr:uncharacterized protein LOC124381643 [Silurus meridionalis]